MTFFGNVVQLAGPLGVLLISYFFADKCLRGPINERLTKFMGSERALLIVIVALMSLLSLAWRWSPVSVSHLRAFATAIACLLAWNAATRDIDPTRKGQSTLVQYVILPVAALSWVSPAFLLLTALLLSWFLHFWLHHATFPMRVLSVLVAAESNFAAVRILDAWTAAPLDTWQSLAPATVLLVVMQASHYFITFLAKAFLGPQPHSWVTQNKIHYLAANAYSWGWARFVPWEKWLRLVHLLARHRVVLQLFAFLLEALAPLALLHRSLAVGLSLAFALFHCGVFAVSGLLFWDWIATDLMLAFLFASLPTTVATEAFGIAPLALGCLVLFLFPMRHILWKPMPLGWFDTPLTARILWVARGESGKRYRVYNDFMCPYERLYGRVNGCFFVPTPVVTYHLGEVWKLDLRDQIESAGPHPEALDLVRKRYGILPHSSDLRARHLNFLQAFFSHFNAGARKSILPDFLRWLKAPGDQIFYWGDLDAYQRQEKVTELELRYVEEYFDGSQLVRLCDEEVARVTIPESPPADCAREPTPSELDMYLLGMADGRLLELPRSKKRYAGALSEN